AVSLEVIGLVGQCTLVGQVVAIRNSVYVILPLRLCTVPPSGNKQTRHKVVDPMQRPMWKDCLCFTRSRHLPANLRGKLEVGSIVTMDMEPDITTLLRARHVKKVSLPTLPKAVARGMVTYSRVGGVAPAPLTATPSLPWQRYITPTPTGTVQAGDGAAQYAFQYGEPDAFYSPY
ncbi:hypothetical protein KIPB_015596, partial [Kipferlia bialata]